MSYILKEKFKTTTRYIYMVEYDQKKGEDYEVITRVFLFSLGFGGATICKKKLGHVKVCKSSV